MENFLIEEVTSNKKIALLGIGRLQLGLIAPLFSNLGYDVILVSFHNNENYERLKNLKYYLVIDNPPNEGYKVNVAETLFYDFKSPGSEEVLSVVSQCQIVNCALGLSEASVNTAARFLLDLEMYRKDNSIIDTLFISSADNPIGTQFGIELIHKKFQAITFELPEKIRLAIWNDVSHHIAFVKTIADRICAQRILNSNRNSPLEIITEKYGEIIFDKPFLNIRPLLSKETKSLGAIKIWDDPEAARQKKLFTLSMAHAMTAYLGYFHTSSPVTIYQSLQIREVRSMVQNALENVSKAISNKEGGSLHEWFQIAGSAFDRINNEKIDDTIVRVARDAPRKLNRDDRLIGPLLLIVKKLFIIPQELIKTVAIAFLYSYLYDKKNNDEEFDQETKNLGMKIREKGIKQTIFETCGFDETDYTENYIASTIESEFNRILKMNIS